MFAVLMSLAWRTSRACSTAAWGRVYKEVHDRNVNCFLAESVVNLFARHYLTARMEVADKDELFPHPILIVVPRVITMTCYLFDHDRDPAV